MKENKNKYYMYGTIAVISVIIILLISMIFMYSYDSDYTSSEVPVDGITNPEDDGEEDSPEGESEDVIKEENIFSMPIQGEYVIFRHYWSQDLTEEEKNQAIINGKSSVGITIQSVENNRFEVVSPMSGIVTNAGTDERGTYITIEEGSFRVVIYSVQSTTKQIGEEVELGEKIGLSDVCSFDSEAGESVYMELHIKEDSDFKRTDPYKIVGQKVY